MVPLDGATAPELATAQGGGQPTGMAHGDGEGHTTPSPEAEISGGGSGGDVARLEMDTRLYATYPQRQPWSGVLLGKVPMMMLMMLIPWM